MTNQNLKMNSKKLYIFVLRLIKFIDKLPKSSISDIMGKQLLRSGTSILANYIEAKKAEFQKRFHKLFYLLA